MNIYDFPLDEAGTTLADIKTLEEAEDLLVRLEIEIAMIGAELDESWIEHERGEPVDKEWLTETKGEFRDRKAAKAAVTMIAKKLKKSQGINETILRQTIMIESLRDTISDEGIWQRAISLYSERVLLCKNGQYAPRRYKEHQMFNVKSEPV